MFHIKDVISEKRLVTLVHYFVVKMKLRIMHSMTLFMTLFTSIHTKSNNDKNRQR